MLNPVRHQHYLQNGGDWARMDCCQARNTDESDRWRSTSLSCSIFCSLLSLTTPTSNKKTTKKQHNSRNVTIVTCVSCSIVHLALCRYANVDITDITRLCNNVVMSLMCTRLMPLGLCRYVIMLLVWISPALCLVGPTSFSFALASANMACFSCNWEVACASLCFLGSTTL